MSLHPLLLLFLFLFLLSFTLQAAAQPHPNFTAALFFGDSTLDTGNNKFLFSPFKSDHFPYGLNFPNRTATGRFSNGFLVPDLLSAALNIKPLSPPFLDPKLSDWDIRTGVNFASAGSGYDELTSAGLNTAPISRQLRMFEEYLKRLKGIVGEGNALGILENALVMLSAGGNDVIFNFYDSPSRAAEYNMSGYQDFLQGILEDSVKNVYNHGARKFIVAGLPPVGCLPVQISASFKNPADRKCVDEQISDTITYNLKLQTLLLKLQQSLPGSKLAYLDLTDSVIEILNNPAKYGFEETRRGCCGTGFFEVGPLCNNLTPVCRNISNFAFFDAIHPSERVYKLVTERIMKDVISKLY